MVVGTHRNRLKKKKEKGEKKVMDQTVPVARNA